jgi:hypothetical protein
MVLALPVLAAALSGLLLGGRLERLTSLPLRRPGLFWVAIGIQVVAFPFAFLPWTTGDTAARILWLASYALLIVATILNRHVAGVAVVGAGMVLNVLAVVANGGHMPVSQAAMRAAGESYAVKQNSAAIDDPSLPWLIDRFAAPDWLPLGNVFSLGDVVIAVGAVVIVWSGMGVWSRGSAPRRVGV